MFVNRFRCSSSNVNRNGSWACDLNKLYCLRQHCSVAGTSVNYLISEKENCLFIYYLKNLWKTNQYSFSSPEITPHHVTIFFIGVLEYVIHINK